MPQLWDLGLAAQSPCLAGLGKSEEYRKSTDSGSTSIPRYSVAASIIVTQMIFSLLVIVYGLRAWREQ